MVAFRSGVIWGIDETSRTGKSLDNIFVESPTGPITITGPVDLYCTADIQDLAATSIEVRVDVSFGEDYKAIPSVIDNGTSVIFGPKEYTADGAIGTKPLLIRIPWACSAKIFAKRTAGGPATLCRIFANAIDVLGSPSVALPASTASSLQAAYDAGPTIVTSSAVGALDISGTERISLTAGAIGLNLAGATPGTGAGVSITMAAGNSIDSNGGDILSTAGNTFASGGENRGGNVSYSAGNGSPADGATSGGGNVDLRAGDARSGTPGDITLTAGISDTTTGRVILNGSVVQVSDDLDIGQRLIAGNTVFDVDQRASNAVIAATDDFHTIIIDATAGPRNVVAPDATTVEGRVLVIKKADATGNAVTFVPNVGTGDLVDGAANYPLTSQYDSITVQAAGGDWWII